MRRIRAPQSTLLLKILGVLVATFVVATAVTGVAVARLTRAALMRQARDLASSDLTVLQTVFTDRDAVLLDSLRRVAHTAQAGDLTQPDRRPELLAELAVLQENLHLDVLQVLDSGGSVLMAPTGDVAFVSSPAKELRNRPRLMATRRGDPVQAAVVGMSAGDRPPFLVGGYRFGDGYAYELRRRISSRDDVILVAGGKVAGATLATRDGIPLPDSDPEAASRLARLGGVDSLVRYVPIGAPGGSVDAIGVALSDPVSLLSQALARDRLVAGGILLLLVLGLGWLFFRALTRPLVSLAETASLVARGDLEASFTARRRDEIGALGDSLQRMTVALREQAAQLQESAKRLVSAQDGERRRLARDLHDGAQQRLVSLALSLRMARRGAEASGSETLAALDQASGELALALSELRELARGIHPAVLTDGGLAPAIESLADRSPVPATVDETPEGRLPGSVEATAYFIVSEALANVAKYAHASEVRISVRHNDGTLLVEVADDGIGGADPARGSGLRGLADRTSALGGTIRLDSPPGGGTRLRAEMPCG